MASKICSETDVWVKCPITMPRNIAGTNEVVEKEDGTMKSVLLCYLILWIIGVAPTTTFKEMSYSIF